MDWHGWIWVRPTIEDNQQCQFWSGKWWSTNINWILSGYPIDTSSLFSDTLRLSCLLFVAKKNRQMAGHPLRIWSPKFFDGLSLGASGISSQDICSHTREYLYNAYVCMYVYIYICIYMWLNWWFQPIPIILPLFSHRKNSCRSQAGGFETAETHGSNGSNGSNPSEVCRLPNHDGYVPCVWTFPYAPFIYYIYILPWFV